MNVQANYEKNVFGKTSRTNARGEGACCLAGRRRVPPAGGWLGCELESPTVLLLRLWQ